MKTISFYRRRGVFGLAVVEIGSERFLRITNDKLDFLMEMEEMPGGVCLDDKWAERSLGTFTEEMAIFMATIAGEINFMLREHGGQEMVGTYALGTDSCLSMPGGVLDYGGWDGCCEIRYRRVYSMKDLSNSIDELEAFEWWVLVSHCEYCEGNIDNLLFQDSITSFLKGFQYSRLNIM